MEDLPTPLSRIELYLAKIAGMDVTIPEYPESRLEMFLAVLAGDTNVEMPTPYPLVEQWLKCVYYGTTTNHPAVEGAMLMGNQEVDTRYFAVASGVAGATLPPAPQNRKEEYWAVIATAGPIHGVLKYISGSNIVLTDVVRGIESLDRFNGDTTQITYSGEQLLKKDGMATPSTDTTYWSSFSTNLTQTPKNNGWSTMTRTVTSGYSNFQTSTSSVDIVAGSTYTAIVEIENCTITSGSIVFVQTNATQDPVESYTIVAGCNNVYDTSMGASLTGSTTPKYNVYVFNTKSGFTRGLRYYIGQYSGSGSFDIRATVLAGDHSSDWQNYCGDNWQPFVGGIPSPNPDYPQNVNVATGRQAIDVFGSNLFDYATMDMAHKGFSAATGVLSGAGTNRLTSLNAMELEKGEYILSFDTLDSCWILAYDLQGNYLGNGYIQSSWDDTNTKVFTLDQDCLIRISLRYSDNSLVEVKNYNIQIKPYSDYEVNLGKNLFDKDNCNAIPNGYFYDTGNISIGTAGNNYLVWIPCEPDTAYSFRLPTAEADPPISIKKICTTETEPASGVAILQPTADIDRTASEYSNFVTASNAHYICVRIRGTGIVNNTEAINLVLNTLQVEKGAIATSYASYFTPIELCKIGEYQDYIYKDGDDWYLHKAIVKNVLDGNTTIGSVNTQLTTVARATALGTNIGQSAGGIISDKFITKPGWNNNEELCYKATTSNNIFLFINKSRGVSDVATASTWLSNNPVTTYYAIPTPTDTKITNTALIEQLDALDSAVLPKPNANIVVSGNIAGSLEISYYGRAE